MTTVLVTGAAGFVGSRLAVSLASSPEIEVRTLVRRAVEYLPRNGQVIGDLLDDRSDLSPLLTGVDTVVHLAGANEVAARDDPALALQETVRAAERVRDAAIRAGVPRLVFVSTVHVYGSAITEGAVLTEDTPPRPSSAYASARLACEQLLESASSKGLEVVVFRLTNSVGAPVAVAVDRWTLVANDLCRQAAVANRIQLSSDGAQWRDFVALSDVVRLLEVTATHAELVPAGTYNLGSGVPMTVRALAHLVQDVFVDITGQRPSLVAPPPPANPPRSYRVDVGRLAALGVPPFGEVRSGVVETGEFCVSHKEQL